MAANMVGTFGLEAVEAVVGVAGDASTATAATAAKVATACPELLLLEGRKLLGMAKELRGMVRENERYTLCGKTVYTSSHH